jgi:hypothetical protein
VLRLLQEEGLLKIFSPALPAGKLNLQGLSKLEKSFRLAAEGNGLKAERLGPFLYVLAEKLNAKERLALIKCTDLRKAEVDLWQKLEGRARKLEGALKSARLKKPSQVYAILSKAADDEVVFILYHSQNKLVQERIRNYVQKYVPLAQEFPAAELQQIEAKPGTPKYEKARDALLSAFLDRRPRKPAALPGPPPPPPPVVEVRGRARQ